MITSRKFILVVSALIFMNFFLITISTEQASAEENISFRASVVNAWDDRNLGVQNSGAWLIIRNVSINGSRIERSNFEFSIGASYIDDYMSIHVSSRRTVPSLSAQVADRVNTPEHGNRFFIRRDTISSGLPRVVRSLNRRDQEVIYAICHIMSDAQSVREIYRGMVRDRSGDSVYAEYWQNPRRVDQMVNLASSCMRQMRRLVQFDAPPQVAASTQSSVAAAPVASAPSTTSSSPADQVRLAQTILAAMGLYTSSIDGVAGPRTNRALTAGMQQLNSTAAPTVENFLRVAVGRIRTLEQPAAAPSNTAELAELRVQNANLTSQLESARREVTAVASELAEARSALATLLVETSAASGDANAAQDVVAALEAQLAELSAAHAAEVAELTAAVEQARTEVRSNDAANATIADLREELEALRPLTAQLDTLTEQNTSLQRQLSAANETVADLRDGIASDERVTEIQRQLDAANATVANLRDEMTAAYVPVADYVALQRQVSALNANNTEMRDRIEADFVPRTEYAALEVSSNEAQASLRSQMAAANQTVAELRERMNTAYVPVADHLELQRQLAAASATTTELRETMRTDYVSKSDFLEAQRILAATNESMADLRRSIETQFMPLEDYVRLERQVSALNSTILELQDRNEIQRNRMLESESLFRNFREDCAAVPECARAMRLD